MRRIAGNETVGLENWRVFCSNIQIITVAMHFRTGRVGIGPVKLTYTIDTRLLCWPIASECLNKFFQLPLHKNEQSGAVEACWAHNPEVRGSKPRSANNFFLVFF